MSDATLKRKIVLAAGLAAALAVSTAALAVDQGRINCAVAALKKADALVQAAGADRAGHTARAIANIDAAIAELQAVTGP